MYLEIIAISAQQTLSQIDQTHTNEKSLIIFRKKTSSSHEIQYWKDLCETRKGNKHQQVQK